MCVAERRRVTPKSGEQGEWRKNSQSLKERKETQMLPACAAKRRLSKEQGHTEATITVSVEVERASSSPAFSFTNILSCTVISESGVRVHTTCFVEYKRILNERETAALHERR